MNKYLIDFEIGDWSHDGHGQSTVHYYNVNITPNKVRKALNESSDYMKQLCGYGIEDICNDYDDTAIPEQAIGYLYEIGFFENDVSINELAAKDSDDNLISLSEWNSLDEELKKDYEFVFVEDYSDYSNFHGSGDFVKMLLLMIKSKLSDFEYEEATNESTNMFCGGYGFGY